MTNRIQHIEGGEELTCKDCGRHFFRAIRSRSEHCAACIDLPSWWKVPELARVIDPEHARTVADE